jgi:hypothetical protein
MFSGSSFLVVVMSAHEAKNRKSANNIFAETSIETLQMEASEGYLPFEQKILLWRLLCKYIVPSERDEIKQILGTKLIEDNEVL